MKTVKTERSKNGSKNKAKDQKPSNKKTEAGQLINVNQYLHFLQVPSVNSSSIKWALGLRSRLESKSMHSIAVTPQLYYKSIEGQKVKHTTSDISVANLSQFEHLALRREGARPSAGQLNFQTNLRNSQTKDKETMEKEKKWWSIPKVERHEQPKFIKSKSIKNKIIQPEELELAADGQHHYPQFTEKIIKDRNCNQYRHMMKSRVNLPSISWQVNLRCY